MTAKTLNQKFYAELAGETGHFAHAWDTRTDDLVPELTADTQFVLSYLGKGGMCSAVARAQFQGPDRTWQPVRTYQWLQEQRAPQWSDPRRVDEYGVWGGWTV